MLRKFVGSSFATFAIKILGVGIAFFTQIFLARIMGVTDYGSYVYIMTLVNIFLLFSKVGLDVTVIRFIPDYLSNKKWMLFNGIRRKSLQITTLLSISISISLWGVYQLANSYYYVPEWGNSLLFAFFLLPILAINVVRAALLRSLKKVVASTFLDAIIRPAFLLLFVYCFYRWVSTEISPSNIILFNIESGLIVFLIGSILLRRSISKMTTEKKYEYRTKEWLLVSYSMFFISAINMIQNHADIIMIEYFIDTKSVGIYSIANQISGFISFGLLSANSVLAPMISGLYHSNKRDQLQKLITFSTRIVFVFTTLSAIFIIFFGDDILALFGLSFVDGLEAMKILIVGQIINALTGSVGFIMTMTGHQKQANRILIISVIVNVSLNSILIPLYGINGAATATAISLSLWNIIMFIYVFKRIGFSSTIFSFSKAVKNAD